MMWYHIKNILLIALTFLLALMLSVLPLPAWANWLRPAWVPLVLIYWVLVLPHRVSLGVAWMVGLLLDALNGTLLGQYAVALVLIAYLVAKLHPRIRLFPIWQQALYVLLSVFLYQLVQLWVLGVIGELPSNLWLYWLPSLTSMVLWPWVYAVLSECRRRFGIYTFQRE